MEVKKKGKKKPMTQEERLNEIIEAAQQIVDKPVEKIKLGPNGKIPKITEATLPHIIHAASRDYSIAEIASYINVHYMTLQNFLKAHPDIAEQVELKRCAVKSAARENVYSAIVEKHDVDVSRWYLERKVKDEFSKMEERKVDARHSVYVDTTRLPALMDSITAEIGGERQV